MKIGHKTTKPKLMKAGVHQSSVLEPFPHIIYTSHCPTLSHSIYCTFADDIAIMISDHDAILHVINFMIHKDLNILFNKEIIRDRNAIHYVKLTIN